MALCCGSRLMSWSILSETNMMKSHIYRRAGVVHMSAEAQAAHEYVAAWATDVQGLSAEIRRLRALLNAPSPKISAQALAGATIGIDIARLLIAATPAETLADLSFKELVLGDREPSVAETALLPVLLEASIRADRFRLGVAGLREAT
jgi:hypothetical protein